MEDFLYFSTGASLSSHVDLHFVTDVCVADHAHFHDLRLFFGPALDEEAVVDFDFGFDSDFDHVFSSTVGRLSIS